MGHLFLERKNVVWTLPDPILILVTWRHRLLRCWDSGPPCLTVTSILTVNRTLFWVRAAGLGVDLYLCSDQGGFVLSSRSSLWTLEAGVCHASLARLRSQIPRLCLDPSRLGHVLDCNTRSAPGNAGVSSVILTSDLWMSFSRWSLSTWVSLVSYLPTCVRCVPETDS